jgi:acyl-homoserine lactone acylase PvdQ
LLPLDAAQAGDVKIIRDDFGIPHIFGETDEGVSFGLGYAQAEDRLEELLRNYRLAEGTMSEVFGKQHYQHDYRQRLWRHREVSMAHYHTLSERSRRSIEAFQEGIKAYMKEHPGEVPDWVPELHPWQVPMLSRFIIWGWPEGDAAEDLENAKIPFDPVEYHGSNQWLIAPSRSASGAPIALIDPHLSWYGHFRFYECRLYGKEVKVSGVCVLGSSLPALGHSQWCSVAMTTGSGDTADVFEEIINPDNPLQYQVDGQWRDMTVRHEIIRVKKQDNSIDESKVDISYTHHGPIVAHKDGKAYSMAIPYMEDIGLTDQTLEMMTAKNLDEMKKALSRLSLMGQNTMIGTIDGDIYYQRSGKVPIRAEGVDPSKPIPGHLSENDWKGIHPAEDLVQVTNPAQGYMQNCNVSPFAMMKNSPMRLADYPAYVYGTPETPPHQRAAMVIEILDQDSSVTIDEALSLAMCTQIYNAGKWQQRLKEAWGRKESSNAQAAKVFSLITEWNQQSDPGSTGALAFKYWKDALPESARKGDKMGDPPPASLTDEEVVTALEQAARNLIEVHGNLEVAYGDVYRVGRRGGKESWPVGGGNPGSGMATPRNISFGGSKEGKFIGQGGQTATQVVLLTKPPKSWSVIPLGESDHPESGHWDDQAENLFSKGLLKSSYFMDPEGLKQHTESEKVLRFE